MTLNEFVEKYNGTKVGDGQCVALIKKYESEVLGITPVAVGNAHNYYDNYENEKFLYTNYNRYENNGVNLPKAGDLIVWSTAVGGGAGHIAIAYREIKKDSFISFDQNWNTPLLCNIETHSYSNVLGWLRFKSYEPVPSEIIKKKKFNWSVFTNNIRKRR